MNASGGVVLFTLSLTVFRKSYLLAASREEILEAD